METKVKYIVEKQEQVGNTGTIGTIGTNSDKDKYTIKDVLERYGLKTRQSFYTWTKALDITIGRDIDGKSIITPEQIKLLDELNQHLKNGGMIKTFTPILSPQIIENVGVNSTIDAIGNDDKNIMKTTNEVTYQQLELFDAIVNRVTELINVSPINRSPINHWDELNKAVENGYILTSKEIKELLGVKPFGKEWTRGAFKFTKVGKIGNQAGWKVDKS